MEQERDRDDGPRSRRDAKWREGGTRLGGGGDVGLPASEIDSARILPEEDDGRPGRGGPGTISPPD